MKLDSLYSAVRRVPVQGKVRNKTARLRLRGRQQIAKKVGEEAVEVVIAALSRKRPETISESVDLLYHLVVLWADMKIDPAEIWEELEHRIETKAIL